MDKGRDLFKSRYIIGIHLLVTNRSQKIEIVKSNSIYIHIYSILIKKTILIKVRCYVTTLNSQWPPLRRCHDYRPLLSWLSTTFAGGHWPLSPSLQHPSLVATIVVTSYPNHLQKLLTFIISAANAHFVFPDIPFNIPNTVIYWIETSNLYKTW